MTPTKSEPIVIPERATGALLAIASIAMLFSAFLSAWALSYTPAIAVGAIAALQVLAVIFCFALHIATAIILFVMSMVTTRKKEQDK